jgi:hypothetical protein
MNAVTNLLFCTNGISITSYSDQGNTVTLDHPAQAANFP